MGGSPPISIDQNGLMTGVPDLIGSYVVGVCIEETRNGVLMSRMRRDYEFNVVACEENLVASIEASEFIEDTSLSEEPIAYFESCDPITLNFVNQSVDEMFIQDYLWEIRDPDNNLHFSQVGLNNKDAQVYFEDEGRYTGTMVLNDGATCFDTAFFVVYIVPETTLETSCVYDTCVAGPVNFLNQSEAEHSSLTWLWEFGDGNNSTEETPQHLYDLRGQYTVRTVATDTFGCSSSQTKILDWVPYELLPPDTIQIDTLLCAEDSIFIFDRWISNSGIFLDYLPSTFTGCDSIVQEISVLFRDELIPEIEFVEICEDDIYDFYGTPISTSGEYVDTLLSTNGCDSLVVVSLTVINSQRLQQSVDICPDETFVFGDSIISEPGIYLDTFTNLIGCDSIIALRVTEISEKFTTLFREICEGDNYIINGDTLIDGGIYDYEFVAESGCDSTVTLTLVDQPTYLVNIEGEICENGIYTLGDIEISEAGTHTYRTSTVEGCDSIIELELTVLPESEHEFQDTICLGETYPFGSLDLTIPGIYYDTLTNTNGCDSLIVLDLSLIHI